MGTPLPDDRSDATDGAGPRTSPRVLVPGIPRRYLVVFSGFGTPRPHPFGMKITSPLARLFGPSPFRPIQEHMHLAEQCAGVLPELFDAVGSGDRAGIDEAAKRVSELEHQADEAKNAIRSALPAVLFLPVPRQDLLALLATQDAIADQAEEVASLVALARQPLEEGLRGPVADLAAQALGVVAHARVLVDRLDELVEVGFRGREVEGLLEGVEELAHLESRADRNEKALIALLFERQEALGPLAVVFWYEVVRMIGRIADEGENVGDRLRLLVAR